MPETEVKTTVAAQRMLLRISAHSILLAVGDRNADCGVAYETHAVNPNCSLPANLRTALSESELLRKGYDKVRVMADVPTLLVPIEEYEMESERLFLSKVFPNSQNDNVHHQVINELNAVAVFPTNKDLDTVIGDNFSDIKMIPVVMPVWRHMHNVSFVGTRRKLFCFFHDGKIEIFCYEKNRFKFSNSFDIGNSHDCIYYILYIWKQLALDTDSDEILLLNIPEEQSFCLTALRKYVRKVYVYNFAAELNRSPLSKVKDLPIDMLMQLTNR